MDLSLGSATFLTKALGKVVSVSVLICKMEMMASDTRGCVRGQCNYTAMAPSTQPKIHRLCGAMAVSLSFPLLVVIVVYVTHKNTSVFRLVEEVFLERYDSNRVLKDGWGLQHEMMTRQLRERIPSLAQHITLWIKKASASNL